MQTGTTKTLAVIAAVALASCTRPRPAVYMQTASIIVESDPGAPLEGASVAVDGQPVASTLAKGEATVRVQGVAGDKHRIEVHCPEGHLGSSPPFHELFVRVPERGARAPSFVVRCEPAMRTATIRVRIEGGPGLPLTHLGRPVGRTDAKGEALLTMLAEPGEDLEVTADTSLARDLHPQNPSLTFPMGAKDETFVFAQKLTPGKKAPPPPVKRAPKPGGPVRLANKAD